MREFHEKWYGKDFEYQDSRPSSGPSCGNPTQWAKLFKRAGARYVVLVSKHHDGYALWPSEHASSTRGYPWNSMEIGPKRDLCGELAEAVRAEGLKMGFYYSFMEWENPLYDADKARYVEEHMIPQIKDLVTRYKPAVFWPDGEWDHPDTLWRSPEILAWLYNNVENPEEFCVNDRWGKGCAGRRGLLHHRVRQHRRRFARAQGRASRSRSAGASAAASPSTGLRTTTTTRPGRAWSGCSSRWSARAATCC